MIAMASVETRNKRSQKKIALEIVVHEIEIFYFKFITVPNLGGYLETC